MGNTECCFWLGGGFLFEGIQSVAFDQEEVFCLRECRVLFFTMGRFFVQGNTECCFLSRGGFLEGIQSVVFYNEAFF